MLLRLRKNKGLLCRAVDIELSRRTCVYLSSEKSYVMCARDAYLKGCTNDHINTIMVIGYSLEPEFPWLENHLRTKNENPSSGLHLTEVFGSSWAEPKRNSSFKLYNRCLCGYKTRQDLHHKFFGRSPRPLNPKRPKEGNSKTLLSRSDFLSNHPKAHESIIFLFLATY